MKGRTHCIPTSEPPDDWIDGSWTVDCVCGVNFDDGEEMVNCDECGVWVHTRCSKYVKGEKSFACDKCKSKNNSRNDSEETEVAQLLVELPTKTMRMDNPYPPATDAARRPFRLWTEMPIEERVHVQGVPGGDPDLFRGLSSVFTPELWKCSGYVPKKFNFQYRELPCWDENGSGGGGGGGGVKVEEEKGGGGGGGDVRVEEENENMVDKGAGVLFSLSKEMVLDNPAGALVGLRGGQIQESCLDGMLASKSVKKEKSLIRPFGVHSGKRKKEDSGMSKPKDRGEKKVRALEKDADSKRRSGHSSKKAGEEKILKAVTIGTQHIKNESSRGIAPQDPASNAFPMVDNNVDKPKSSMEASDHPSKSISSALSRPKSKSSMEASDHPSRSISSALSRPKLSAEPRSKEEDKTAHQVPTMISNKSDSSMNLAPEDNDFGGHSCKREVVTEAVGGSNGRDDESNNDTSNLCGVASSVVVTNDTEKTMLEDQRNATVEINNVQTPTVFDGDSLRTNFNVKAEEGDNNPGGVVTSQSSPVIDAKLEGPTHADPEIPIDHLSEKYEVNDATESTDPSTDHKVQDVDKSSDRKNEDELSGVPCQLKQESEGTIKDCEQPILRHPDEAPKTGGKTVGSSPAPPSQRKMVVSISKSSSSSSPPVQISIPSVSENCKPTSTQNPSPPTNKQTSKKDHPTSGVITEEEKHDKLKKLVKEHPKVASQEISKVTASSSSQRGEKFNSSNSQLSKVNYSQPMHPPVPSKSPSTLSDEELALLLHQELNSSPRVPRVPRVRHAGSLPQLTAPTATSMLIKRSSNSAVKDNSSVSRRKSKDVIKDGFRKSRQLDDESKKMDKLPPSPDHQRRPDSEYSEADTSTKVEVQNESLKDVNSIKNPTTSGGPSSSMEANDQMISTVQNSAKNISDEDTAGAGGPHQTLPGLINEIMSEGKRMTYEELCNAVLPHWRNLRKHNGERYAYSSHSQAVLDCLRNRNEWARLVDRGPKTNASRKRRKVDGDSPNFESEDNENVKSRSRKLVKGLVDPVPKGKRNKRRRLALQGRKIKDVRKSQEPDMVYDDDDDEDDEPLASTEESIFSDGDIQGPLGSEASASSDDTETAS